MEVKGTIVEIGEVQEINPEYKKQNVVIETGGEYPKKICLTVSTKLIGSVVMLKKGQNITASINLESREHDGRWYTEVKMWKFLINN